MGQSGMLFEPPTLNRSLWLSCRLEAPAKNEAKEIIVILILCASVQNNSVNSGHSVKNSLHKTKIENEFQKFF